MWKWNQDEKPTAQPTKPPQQSPRAAVQQPTAPAYTPPAKVPAQEVRTVESKPLDSNRTEVAHIGKSVVVRGELSGSEDLFLDGEVEGSIELRGQSLIVGPNGRVRANVHARNIVVHGKVDGNLHGGERVELKKSAILVGDIFTQRIVIEDGAYFKGGIDIQKEAAKDAKVEPKPEPKPEPKRETPASAAVAAQGALIETKP